MSITHPVFRFACAAALVAAALVPQATLAAGTLAPEYSGEAHHNTNGDSEDVFLGWNSVTPHAGGKFTAILVIQAQTDFAGDSSPGGSKVPITSVPITGKVTSAGKVTFSGKFTQGSNSLTIKDGKGQLSALGHWVLGTFTLQNKNVSATGPGKYTFDIAFHEA